MRTAHDKWTTTKLAANKAWTESAKHFTEANKERGGQALKAIRRKRSHQANNILLVNISDMFYEGIMTLAGEAEHSIHVTH